ncbi:2-amino-4-hydroxy-6-hydroxymethyldihydropteridine diphosphokinase [Hyphobacterium sp.]|uniref:2-amino-4-hydroxy-6- hydroxymethyldihydropteridine diphosphokinase n=1 Tax=Hyphobacterium sp. TaxID=2004662 RepID=UPI003B52B976
MNSDGPIYIALGANLPFDGGTPQDTLQRCQQVLAGRGVAIRAISGFWRSPAWPDRAKPDYLNAVAEIDTDFAPVALLDLLLEVEARFGRVREARWDSRTLDLDLIDYAECQYNSDRLTLPHPRATSRAFVLLPLQEIAREWHDPVSGMAIKQLIAALPDADRAATVRIDD